MPLQRLPCPPNEYSNRRRFLCAPDLPAFSIRTAEAHGIILSRADARNRSEYLLASRRAAEDPRKAVESSFGPKLPDALAQISENFVGRWPRQRQAIPAVAMDGNAIRWHPPAELSGGKPDRIHKTSSSREMSPIGFYMIKIRARAHNLSLSLGCHTTDRDGERISPAETPSEESVCFD